MIAAPMATMVAAMTLAVPRTEAAGLVLVKMEQ